MRSSNTRESNRSGHQRAVAQPVYENFEPMSEWIQDQEYDILLIYMPGFMKENISVTTEGKNIIRVRGDRLISSNKWNRLMEDYRVPNDCNLQGTRAKFQGGILTIKVPKKTTVPPLTIGPKDEAKLTLEQASMAAKRPKDAQPELPMPEKKDNSEALASQKMSSEATTKKGRDKEEQNIDKRSTTRSKDSEHAIDQDAATYWESIETKGKPDKPTNVTENKSKPGKDGGGDAQADKTDEYAEPKANQTTNANASGSTTSYCGLEKCMQSLRGLIELDEERQLLVNVGVAVLIIGAIGTYAVYNKSEK